MWNNKSVYSFIFNILSLFQIMLINNNCVTLEPIGIVFKSKSSYIDAIEKTDQSQPTITITPLFTSPNIKKKGMFKQYHKSLPSQAI